MLLISVVIPVRNEEETIPVLVERLAQVFDGKAYEGEFVFVNDGSTDRTVELISRFRDADPRIACVDLSRGFGKEIALTAGMQHASGDAIVLIDADLQDPPELIERFVELWQTGYDVVYATRTHRKGESALKRATAFLFYRVVEKTSQIRIPRDTGDFRLMSRRAVDALLLLPEHHRFMKGLFAWVGFPQISVPYERDMRAAGTTKFNYWKLWNFAIEGITSFSTAPLKFATYLGLVIAMISFLYALVIVWQTLLHGNPVPGYPSLMTVILFLGGVQLMTIGVLGEYVGRIFNETKRRPLYLTRQFLPSRHGRVEQPGGEADGADAVPPHAPTSSGRGN
jgi:glycosyltransferase involved in cell wall biosynthesis